MEENLDQDIIYSEKQVSILMATEKLISEKGYAATSVRDISQAAGINVAMISYYFGSKEKLLEALFVYRIGSSRVLLQSLLDNTMLDPFQKLEVLVQNYVGKWLDNFSFFQIMTREPAIKEVKEISKIVNATKQRNQRMVARLIEEGQANHFFKANVDVTLMMHTIMGTMMSVCNNTEYLKMIYNAEKMQNDEFIEMLRKKLNAHLYHMMKAALSLPEKNTEPTT
ncbi:TetR/AcrR family transcriptional regulator [Flavihumibacter fluvii]|uniref:TetR/AcrR family transcriptional regulator n=1 Tax=Flavihumibacter fluvii TaxID=2838157 RepID=UPI001BDEB243|nr:TetR/AcrR family transcriptional regulator [Flavihumibacter fluvii]ULQ53450.1 TetR/AcrR family transcriptional regulator [Flavihumibacter fluvii]